jgi:ABC-type uncharacterized transport system involved in gliding motility auxiliary subunit
MKVRRYIHQRLAIKQRLLTLLILSVLICLAVISRLYPIQVDLTANASNTISVVSEKILSTLADDVSVTVYTKSVRLKKQITQLLGQYLHFKKNINVNFIDPGSVLDKARALSVGSEGMIIIGYQGREEKIKFFDEFSFSNALLQLTNTNERWVTFITGHGERSPTGKANFDFSVFSKQLLAHKIKTRSLNLAQLSAIPDNSSLLVLASPMTPLLLGELKIIDDYIKKGGNLLLLTDPSTKHLQKIEQKLGIKKRAGTIVDSSSGLYGIDDPTFVLVSEYKRHPILLNFSNITVFPVTAALEFDEKNEFKAQPLLTSVLRSWTETGEIVGKVRFDKESEEKEGPLNFAYALTRNIADKKQQRVVVIGDGDFLSNTFLGNVGNSDLGGRIINWLIGDDQLIEIPIKLTTGKSLKLSKSSIAVIGFGVLIILPLLFFITGIVIWRKRKRR